MSELHILDEETDGNRHHIRQYDEETIWAVEVIDDRRAIKYLATIGAEPVEARYADSALYRLDTAAAYRLPGRDWRLPCEAVKESKAAILARTSSGTNRTFA